MTGKTAILIFANSSSEELKTKKIQRSALLFDHLNQKVLKIARSTGLPYFLFQKKNRKALILVSGLRTLLPLFFRKAIKM